MNPILIQKSDSTIFANVNKFLTFNLETNLDLTGWQAKFVIGWVKKTIDDISSHSFEIILGAEDTKQLRLGHQYGTIILTDANGNIKTVTNTIPFEVTTAVVENEYQEIDLTIPESSGVDIKLRVGASTVTSVNGMSGDVVGLATEQQLVYGLKTKQDKGDYALKSQIPDISNLANKDEIPTLISELENDSNYATQTDIMQAIASIPQFKLSIVNELPSIGAKRTSNTAYITRVITACFLKMLSFLFVVPDFFISLNKSKVHLSGFLRSFMVLRACGIVVQIKMIAKMTSKMAIIPKSKFSIPARGSASFAVNPDSMILMSSIKEKFLSIFPSLFKSFSRSSKFSTPSNNSNASSKDSGVNSYL